jgi:integrase
MPKKQNSRISLPHNCSCSQLAVSPANWKQVKKITGPWSINFRFYDPTQPKPKQVFDKSMNKFKDLAERKASTEFYLNELLQVLKSGYNPFHKKIILQRDAAYDTGPNTMLVPALKAALDRLKIEPAYKKHIGRYVIPNIDKAAIALFYSNLFISEVKRRHIIFMLDHLRQTNSRFSDNTFNRFRTDLKILFKELVSIEAIENNPIDENLQVKRVEKKERKVLSPAERTFINDLLEEKYPTFHRYLHIFFHSGARSSELLKVRGEDVDLVGQRYRVTIKKGRNYRTVWKVIKDIALPYWEDAMKDCQPSEYLFSKGLKHGKQPIQPYQIHKRWTRLIKDKEFEIEGKKTRIESTFYSLKHLNTGEVVDQLNEEAAAQLNSHESTAMVVSIYDRKQEKRQADKLKKVNNPFA